MEEEIFVSNEADPIISEVPVYLNNNCGSNLVVVQYPTRKANIANTGNSSKISGIRLKEQSDVIEVDIENRVPTIYIDTVRQSSNLGLGQTFSGVLNKNEGKYAVGYLHNDAFYLSLVPKTGQLRPKFKIKKVEEAVVQEEKTEQPQQLRSVQMSVKSTTSEQPRCSSVLDFWRKAEKEDVVEYGTEVLDSEERDKLLGSHETETEVKTAPLELRFL
ncbi:hypothetical protein DASB73_023390 [Starmerella bacillaris]|uniref:Uncharacterized protein n=1 Tax=Starmerella bacillaris TaxID=1247836 RepID=A0AAV5RJM9_STABA|nr:hypothetical protein DASB73_023390 [Starmerella bacillaris]